MRYTSPLTPSLNTGVHGLEWRVPPLAVAVIVRQIGEALRDHDETAGDLLNAANSKPNSLDAFEAAFAVMRRAGLDRVEVAYPRTTDTAMVLEHEAELIRLDWIAGGPVDVVRDDVRSFATSAAVHTRYAQDDAGVVYRLCSSCHRLTADCQPGTPTTCASCAGTRTA